MVCASEYVPDGSVDYAHDREWFTSAAGTGELFYSTPYRDSDSGKPIITISKAVYRDNRLRGVLAADILVDTLVDIIRQARVAENSYAFLVDQNLGMIVHPNAAYAFDDVPRGVMDVPGAPEAEQAGEDGFAPLRGAGLSPETGLQYCRQDRELYLSLLLDYARGAEKTARELEGFYASRDWHGYSILVHSLKSSSRTIGAAGLSALAAKLEAAADAGREPEIAAGHDSLLECLAATAEAIRALPQQEAAEPSLDAEDDEILEFAPE